MASAHRSGNRVARRPRAAVLGWRSDRERTRPHPHDDPDARAGWRSALRSARALRLAVQRGGGAVPATFGTLRSSRARSPRPGRPPRSPRVARRCRCPRIARDPDGRRIELAIAWVPSTAKSPAADPVVFLAGGPGQSALEAFPMLAPAFREMLRQRHVILVDQRGTGGSHPLDCPQAIGTRRIGGARRERPGSRARAWRGDAWPNCADADPRFYTTTDYVADLEAVRRRCAVERVNLVGVSYGTRVALEYLRRHPRPHARRRARLRSCRRR